MRHRADGVTIEHALADTEGVLRATADTGKRWVTVDYLLTETDYRSLERALEDIGFPPERGRWARIRSGWYQNLDLTGRENAAASPGGCCNRPPARPGR
jgi:hypothetical protein